MSVALLIPSTSRKRPWKTIRDSTFVKVFCPTLHQTTSRYACKKKIFFGVDWDDPLLATLSAQKELENIVKELLPECSIQYVTFEGDKIKRGHLTAMWNVLFRIAYDQGFDYFYQCGDDVEFLTLGWMNKCVEKLDSCGQVGCVGPIDYPMGFGFLTQSFVSRKHMEIFGWYFPEEIVNWHCDYWISKTYQKSDKLYMLSDHLIKNLEVTRYDVVDGINSYTTFVEKYHPQLAKAIGKLQSKQVSTESLQSSVVPTSIECGVSKANSVIVENEQPLCPKHGRNHIAVCRWDTLSTRYDLGRLCETLNLQTGVEVGTGMGLFAKQLLTDWPACKEFHIVDVWKHEPNYADGSNVSNEEHELNFQRAMSNLRPWLLENKIRVHWDHSCNAVKNISQIDFVYLDARHDYRGVCDDLEAFWPLVSPGGIMSGNNFLDADEHREYNPSDDWSLEADGTKRQDNKAIKSAVLEFFGKKNLLVYLSQDGPWCSWFVFKQ